MWTCKFQCECSSLNVSIRLDHLFDCTQMTSYLKNQKVFEFRCEYLISMWVFEFRCEYSMSILCSTTAFLCKATAFYVTTTPFCMSNDAYWFVYVRFVVIASTASQAPGDVRTPKDLVSTAAVATNFKHSATTAPMCVRSRINKRRLAYKKSSFYHKKADVRTLKGRLPFKNSPYAFETWSKLISNDSQHSVFRCRNADFGICFWNVSVLENRWTSFLSWFWSFWRNGPRHTIASSFSL